MLQVILLICVSFFLLGLPFQSEATDWVFKGQPKDGSEHYQSSAAEENSRAQRNKLISDCEKTIQMLPLQGDKLTFSDSAMKRSAALGLGSCGLIYGVDHQEEKASRCLNAALEIAKSLGDASEQARMLNNFGIVQALWGKFPTALDYHKRSLTITAGTTDIQNQAMAYNQIGQIAMFMGDYRKASDALEKSLALQAKASHQSLSWLTLDNLGQLYEAWGNHDKALECYRQSLELKKKLGLTGAEVASCVLMGRVHETMRNDKDALRSFQEGLKLCEKHGYPADLVIDHVGNLYLDRGDTKKAEGFIKRAGFWQSLGRFYLMTGNLSDAEDNYVKLLHYSEPKRMLDYLCVANTGLGVIKEQKGDLQSAAEHFRAAIDHIESVRVTLTEPERAEFFNARLGGFYRVAPYKGLARVLMKMNKPTEAFRESEFTKARSFSEGLSRRAPHAMMDVPPDTMAMDAELNQQLAAATRELHKAYEEDDRKSIPFLEKHARSAKDKLATHVDSLRLRYPLFASTRYPEPMNLDQASLTDDEWVLAYDVTDAGIIVYLIKGKKIVKTVFKAVARTEIDLLVEKFRNPLEIESNDSLTDKLGRFNFAAGKKLSAILLRDILIDLLEMSV